MASSPDLKPQVFAVVRRSGHQTLRVFFDEATDEYERIRTLDDLARFGVTYEGCSPRYFALDVPPERSVAELRAHLERLGQEHILEYETTEARVPGSFDDGPGDWGAWSREAVQLMQGRNAAFVRTYALEDAHYHWFLDEALLVFPFDGREVMADICVVGSVSSSAGTFLWAWANDVIPASARRGLEKVRDFGLSNGLGLLSTDEWPGGRAEGLEMAAVAGKILDADGIWIAPNEDLTLFFALSNFRQREVPG